MRSAKATNVIWQVLSSLLGLALFGVGLAVIRRELGQYNMADVLSDLRSIPTAHLLLFVLFAVSDYIVMTGYDALAVRSIGRSLPYRILAPISLIGNIFSINANILTGSTVRYRLYARWKFTLQEVGSIVAFCYATFILGFLTLAGAAFIMNPFSLPTALQIPGASTRTIGAFFLLLVAAYVSLSVRRVSEVRARAWRFGIPIPALAMRQVANGTIEWLLSASALFMLLPGGTSSTFLHFLGAFVVAQFLGQISQSPAGLGVFEASLLVLLPSDVPSSAALASLIVYRVLYYLVPFLIATAGLGWLALQRPKHHEAAATVPSSNTA